MSTNRGYDDDRRTTDTRDDPTLVDRDGDGVPDRDERGYRDVARDERIVTDDGGYGDRRDIVTDGRVVAAEQFGGVKIGSAFFGWLTAMGLAVLLVAIIAAAGTAVGLETGTDANEAASSAGDNADTVSMVGAIAIAVILFISYYAGGYVAGRMARFNGARQGVAVWLWAIVVAIVVAVVGVVAGTKYDVLGNLNSFPRLPVSTDDLTTTGIVALVIALVIALVGAVLGGLAGMRFHRRVDRVVVEG